MKPLLTYYGGKQNLANWLGSMIPEHTVYCEPFCGGAALFFNKEPAPIEVLNDTNLALMRMYAACKQNPDEVYARLDAMPYSQYLHEQSKAVYKNPDQHTDIDVAVAIIYLSKSSFAGKFGSGWSISRSKDNVPSRCWTNHKQRLPYIISRINKVILSCEDAIKCIKRWDCETAFFYVDPPYIGTNQGHYSGYTLEDLDALVQTLKTIKGKFLLSHYAVQGYEFPEEWNLQTKQTFCCAEKMDTIGVREERIELVYSNYEQIKLSV